MRKIINNQVIIGVLCFLVISFAISIKAQNHKSSKPQVFQPMLVKAAVSAETFPFLFKQGDNDRVAIVEVRVSMKAITLVFPDVAVGATGSRTISRRLLHESAWTFKATTGKSEWTDNDVQPGIAYEYQVKRGQAIGYTAAGIAYDQTGYRGRLILVVDTTLAPELGTRLDRLKEDLTGDGWLAGEDLVDGTG